MVVESGSIVSSEVCVVGRRGDPEGVRRKGYRWSHWRHFMSYDETKILGVTEK